MSTNNLTYFLGAGASAGTKEKPAIPILNSFNDALTAFYKDLIKKEFDYKDPNRSYLKITDDIFFENISTHITELKRLLYPDKKLIYSNEFIYFIDHVNRLLIDLNDHTTVDTLARKYYLLGNEGKSDLIKLKAFLSIYFLNLQLNEKKFDMRYDSFVSTILERDKSGNLSLPNNLKILSWNYDLQFEIALKKYHKVNLMQIQNVFGIHPSKTYFSSTRTMNSFGMAKLNGTSGLLIEANTKIISDIDELYPGEISRDELFDLFFGISRGGKYAISPFYRYSWENDNERLDILPNMKSLLHGYAKETMSQTNHLIVIGYSFPPFNRRADIELFNSLPQNSRIYIQDRNPLVKKNVEDIFKDFENKNITIQMIEDVSQFYIPPVYFED